MFIVDLVLGNTIRFTFNLFFNTLTHHRVRKVRALQLSLCVDYAHANKRPNWSTLVTTKLTKLWFSKCIYLQKLISSIFDVGSKNSLLLRNKQLAKYEMNSLLKFWLKCPKTIQLNWLYNTNLLLLIFLLEK